MPVRGSNPAERVRPIEVAHSGRKAVSSLGVNDAGRQIMIPRRALAAYISGMGDSYTSQAMTIANMRALGVTSLFVTCECGRETVLDASDWPGAIEIPAIRRMLKCTGCGERPVDVRPDWKEYSAPGNGRP